MKKWKVKGKDGKEREKEKEWKKEGKTLTSGTLGVWVNNLYNQITARLSLSIL